MIYLYSNGQQNSLHSLYFGGIQLNTGQIVPHSNRVKHIKGDVFALRVKIYDRLSKTDKWISPFQSTKFGYSFTYINTSNAIIGDIWGVNLFLEPTIFHYKRLYFGSHLGAGIAYATEKFNKETNSTNYMISTDLSFSFNALFQLDYQINNQFSCGINAGFSHCSNAALNLPNLGINILNYGINFGYRIFNEEDLNHKHIDITSDKKWAHDFSIGGATRNVNEELNKYYLILTTDYAINRFLNRKNIISLNMHYVLRQGEINDDYYSTTYNSYYGLALGHELLIRKISVITQLGNYLYDTNLNKHYWYARLGVRYYFTPNLFVMANLTNRKQSADYLQYAIGVRL